MWSGTTPLTTSQVCPSYALTPPNPKTGAPHPAPYSPNTPHHSLKQPTASNQAPFSCTTPTCIMHTHTHTSPTHCTCQPITHTPFLLCTPPNCPSPPTTGTHPSLPSLVTDIRQDTGSKRLRATADVYELLRQWDASRSPSPDSLTLNRKVREAVMDDMVCVCEGGAYDLPTAVVHRS